MAYISMKILIIKFAETYFDAQFVQQPVAQILWGDSSVVVRKLGRFSLSDLENYNEQSA